MMNLKHWVCWIYDEGVRRGHWGLVRIRDYTKAQIHLSLAIHCGHVLRSKKASSSYLNVLEYENYQNWILFEHAWRQVSQSAGYHIQLDNFFTINVIIATSCYCAPIKILCIVLWPFHNGNIRSPPFLGGYVLYSYQIMKVCVQDSLLSKHALYMTWLFLFVVSA